MKQGFWGEFLHKYEKFIVAALILFGAALRILWLDALPFGLNQDEASTGYEAWSLLNYGIDRCGNSWPVLLESWGSGQNALYSYLAIPFIAVFGLNVFSLRLVAGIFGSLTLLVFWLLARRCRGVGFGVTALFMLAVNPWHIMISRWALESNLLPFFLLLGVYLTVLSTDKKWALPFAALSFALAIYAYGTAFFFLPVFLILALIWLIRRKAFHRSSFATAAAVFFLVALPITVCQFLNAIGYGGFDLFGFTLPKLTEGRQLMTTVFGGGSSLSENYASFLNLLWKQSDGLPFNSMPIHGIYYMFGLLLAVIGVIYTLGTHRDHPAEAPVGYALLACFVASAFINVNVNRVNMVFLFLIYFSSLGFYVILCKLKSYSFIAIAAVVISFSLFINDYQYSFSGRGSAYYYPGLGSAIEYVDERNPDSVYISNYVNQPYIFALFYTETPPYEFLQTVDYYNIDGAFRHVNSFGKYRFGAASDAGGEYLILHRNEAEGRAELARFGDYVVCYGTE